MTKVTTADCKAALESTSGIPGKKWKRVRKYKDGENRMAILTPITYFKRNGYCYDQHLTGLVTMPPGFAEEMEAAFGYDGTLADAIKKLRAAGFVFDDKYSAFVEGSM